jgi:hypothetical protein
VADEQSRTHLSIFESELMKEASKKEKRSGLPVAKIAGPARRRERRKRWVQRGQYAVEVEVEVVYPEDDPSEPCLEPATVRWLDEIARRAVQGDLAYLRRAGRVFQLVPG